MTATKYDQIKEILANMDDCDLVALHNAYCDATKTWDNQVFSIEDFDEIMNGKEPWEIARACFYGRNFCPVDSWFWFNGYGNLESTDYFPCKHGPIYVEDIADYIERTEDNLDYDEIQAILEDDEEEGD